MAGTRNSRAGHNWERQVINELKELGFPSVVTSRAESRNMDNRGVDIFDNRLEGSPEFPYHIQCKAMVNQPNIHGLLTEERLPKDKSTLIFYKKYQKSGSRFMSKGDYVMMKKEDFYNLISKYIDDEER